MNFLHDIYKKTIAENEKNIKFWEDYLENLNSIDFAVYSEKLTVPILVPIGNRILFHGDLQHTNEVTVALGADYFAKCSIKQAEVLRQHRIKNATSKLEEYKKEKEYLQNQLSFSKENISEDVGQDILEHCTEEEDREWRKAHRERVRQYNQGSAKKETTDHSDINDEDLWRRLEELELQEELENELLRIEMNDEDSKEENYNSFVINRDIVNDEHIEEVARVSHEFPQHTSKLDLLKQVIDRQKVLETKLTELKNRDKIKTTTEGDLLSRLDEIEQLEELEDEIDRLDDILDEDSDVDTKKEEEIVTNKQTTSKQIVTFNDENSETLEINFKHSDNESLHEPYDSNKGLMKPSDIYYAYPHFFINETKSILKKSKYKSTAINVVNLDKQSKFLPISEENVQPVENKTIIIKDVTEKNESNVQNTTNDERRTSIFKKRRQQQKP